MSSLIVEVCEISEVKSHPDPETVSLEVAMVKGWEVVIRKGQFKVGDKAIFIPVDAILPASLADRLGVGKYLAKLSGGQEGGRVRAARLRGAKSFGLIFVIDSEQGDNPQWAISTDVAEHFGITKWVPPLRCKDGDAARPHSRFHTYTDIENICNFPKVIADGEEVIFTEKLHGQNARVGYVLEDNESGEAVWTWMAGSHSVRRKPLTAKGEPSKFFKILTNEVKNLLSFVALEFPWKEPKFGVILFLEIFGSGIQDMTYGFQNGEWGFRAFDLAINGDYVDNEVKDELFRRFDVVRVPILYKGPFSKDVVDAHTDGKTAMCDPSQSGKFAGREGIVITPAKERHSFIGRCVLKSISIDYLTRKNPKDEGE